MSARFVSFATGCCLGVGKLRLKGAAKKPWLEIRRDEREIEYLNHQARTLSRWSGGGSRGVVDMVSGKGFYDVCRLRFHHPLLERTMEICGEGGVTEQALTVAGLRGLAMLWVDCGRVEGEGAAFSLLPPEAPALRSALLNLGVGSRQPRGGHGRVLLAPPEAERFLALARPHAHRSIRHRFRPSPRPQLS
jgi:hypothetical protein